jgi:electron transport complex protein RnfD
MSASRAQSVLPPSRRSVPQIMALVLLALLPGILARALLLGVGIVWQLLLAIAVALGFETLMMKLHQRPMLPFPGDLSAPLSAVLLALLLPSQMPWWVLVAGVFVAIVLAKHAYGGLGENLFNPAMAGYAALLIGAPAVFAPAPADGPWTAGNPAWVACLYALGGLFLIGKRIIPWQTPLALLAGAALATLVLRLVCAPEASFVLHGWTGAAFVLAAFFIVTDPVTGCLSMRGRICFGAGTGLLAVLLTRLGGASDGLPFAVLSMNLAAPWIDQHSRPLRQSEGVQR